MSAQLGSDRPSSQPGRSPGSLRLERAPVEPLERDLGAGELRRQRRERRPGRPHRRYGSRRAGSG